MWITALLRRSLDRDLDSGLSCLKRKTLGTGGPLGHSADDERGPNLGDAEVRILRAGRVDNRSRSRAMLDSSLLDRVDRSTSSRKG